MSSSCKPTITELPVYKVSGTGIGESDARKLAGALKIPTKKLRLQDGITLFINSANYLTIPTVTITKPEIIDAHLKATKNHTPEIPIKVRAIPSTRCRPIFMIYVWYMRGIMISTKKGLKITPPIFSRE
jgi:hypothetical protein